MRALLLAGVMAVGWAGNGHAALTGDVVQANFLYPNTASINESGGTKTIANGTTFSFPNNETNAVFTTNQITVNNLAAAAYLPSSFAGIDFSFISGSMITSATEDAASTATYATGSVLTFTGNDIKLNLAGTCSSCVGGEKIILDVTTAVPEPASLALLGLPLGLLGLVTMGRRRGTVAA